MGLIEKVTESELFGSAGQRHADSSLSHYCCWPYSPSFADKWAGCGFMRGKELSNSTDSAARERTNKAICPGILGWHVSKRGDAGLYPRPCGTPLLGRKNLESHTTIGRARHSVSREYCSKGSRTPWRAKTNSPQSPQRIESYFQLNNGI